MNAGISIRWASEADSPAFARLTTELGYPASAEAIGERLAKILGRSDHLVIVAQAGGRVCGWLQAHSADVIESGARVEIVGLIVAEDMRRKGIARLLVEDAERWASAQGINLLVVRTNVSRVVSHQFYAALGFMHSKTQAVYRKRLSTTPRARPSSGAATLPKE
jgi:GNAT superfamily N-acetyltransferase